MLKIKVNSKVINLLMLVASLLASKEASASDYLIQVINNNIYYSEDKEFLRTGDLKFLIKTKRNLKKLIVISLITDVNGISTVSIEDDGDNVFYSTGKNIELASICKSSVKAEKLIIEFKGAYAGVGIKFREVAEQFGQNLWRKYQLPFELSAAINPFTKYYLGKISANKLLAAKQAKDGFYEIKFPSCNYGDIGASYALEDQLNKYVPEYYSKSEEHLNQSIDLSSASGKVHKLTLVPITQQTAKFEALFDSFKRQFIANHITTSTYQFIQITGRDRTAYYNFSYGFVKLKGRWHLIFNVPESSKGFYPASDFSSKGSEKLIIEKQCISACDWHGIKENIIIDFNKLTFKIIEE